MLRRLALTGLLAVAACADVPAATPTLVVAPPSSAAAAPPGGSSSAIPAPPPSPKAPASGVPVADLGPPPRPSQGLELRIEHPPFAQPTTRRERFSVETEGVLVHTVVASDALGHEGLAEQCTARISPEVHRQLVEAARDAQAACLPKSAPTGASRATLRTRLGAAEMTCEVDRLSAAYTRFEELRAKAKAAACGGGAR